MLCVLIAMTLLLGSGIPAMGEQKETIKTRARNTLSKVRRGLAALNVPRSRCDLAVLREDAWVSQCQCHQAVLG